MKEKTRIVLLYLHDHGTSTTREVRLNTPLENNDEVRYQLQKLEEEGWVETEVVDEGQFKVTEAAMTSEGRQWINDTYQDRLTEVETRLDKTRDALRFVVDKLEEEDIVSGDMDVTRKYS